MTETEATICRNIRTRVDALGLNRQQFALRAGLAWAEVSTGRLYIQ